jgi:hypothetical protein
MLKIIAILYFYTSLSESYKIITERRSADVINIELIPSSDFPNDYIFTSAVRNINSMCNANNNYRLFSTDKNSNAKVYFKSIQEGYGFTKREYSQRSPAHKPLYTRSETYIDHVKLKYYTNFYNVLLHELLHVIGLEHPKMNRDKSIMSYSVGLDEFDNIVEDEYFYELHIDDYNGIKALVERDFTGCSLLPYEFIAWKDPSEIFYTAEPTTIPPTTIPPTTIPQTKYAPKKRKTLQHVTKRLRYRQFPNSKKEKQLPRRNSIRITSSSSPKIHIESNSLFHDFVIESDNNPDIRIG